jgi:hypothetical protein
MIENINAEKRYDLWVHSVFLDFFDTLNINPKDFQPDFIRQKPFQLRLNRKRDKFEPGILKRIKWFFVVNEKKPTFATRFMRMYCLKANKIQQTIPVFISYNTICHGKERQQNSGYHGMYRT